MDIPVDIGGPPPKSRKPVHSGGVRPVGQFKIVSHVSLVFRSPPDVVADTLGVVGQMPIGRLPEHLVDDPLVKSR